MALRGQTYNRQLFNNEAWRVFMNTFLNGYEGIINNIQNSCNVINKGTLIGIDTGYFLIQGGLLNVELEPIMIDVPNDETTHGILVCEIDLSKSNTKVNFTQGNIKLLSGTGNYPDLQQDDIVGKIGLYQYEFARYQKEANTNIITTFVDTRTFLDFDSLYLVLQNKISTFDDDFKNWLKQFVINSQEALEEQFNDFNGQFLHWFNGIKKVLSDEADVQKIIDNIDQLVENLSKGLFIWQGYVSTTAPTDYLNIGDLWINSPLIPTSFPVSGVQLWDGNQWITTDDYTPQTWHIWKQDDDTSFYWFGGSWIALAINVDMILGKINEINERLLEISFRLVGEVDPQAQIQAMLQRVSMQEQAIAQMELQQVEEGSKPLKQLSEESEIVSTTVINDRATGQPDLELEEEIKHYREENK